MSSDSEDDSILDNIQKTRELWSNKAETTGTVEFLTPKSPVSPESKLFKSPPPRENQVNGHYETDDIVRFEDHIEEDFDLPDVKSMKSKWETPGPAPMPQKKAPLVSRHSHTNVVHNDAGNLVPVNREVEETKEEYDVELGKLREKFEKEAKAASTRVVWDGRPRSQVSKSAVDQRVNMNKKYGASASSHKQTSSKKRFETEIKAQLDIPASKENVEMPTVELSSIKEQFEKRKDERVITPFTPSTRKPRETSFSSDSSAPPIEIVRYDDPVEEEVAYEIELSSLRKKFEQKASSQQKSPPRRSTVQISTSSVTMATTERVRASSESEAPTEVVKSSEAKYDEMIGEESVKDRLARYKAMTEVPKKSSTSPKFTFQKKKAVTETTVSVKKVEEEEQEINQERDIVRSPPAGTKERPEYTPSVDLEQTKLLFERSSQSSRQSRESRSSSTSPRRSPRSRSIPSPLKRGSRGSSSSSSQSPTRPHRRNSGSSSYSSESSGRGTPQSGSKNKSIKKVGEADVVVLEHSEVNYYYEEGTRHSTKLKGMADMEQENADMSNADVIRPEPAGTKEEPDFVPSVNIRSVRDMFENNKDEPQSRGRAPPPKKIVVEREEQSENSSGDKSPERNPEIVRSTAAGSREEPVYEISIDLKAARSKFESPHRPEAYVPRNTIQKREEEARQRRAAAAAASPRSSESSDTSSEVVKTSEAGVKEKPEYQVDLKAAKQRFEVGGAVPLPVKRETQKVKKDVEIKGDVVRPDPAGTREVVEIKSSSQSAKKVFQGAEIEDEDEKGVERKAQIDIQEEARLAVQKEQNIKQETEKAAAEKNKDDTESEKTDTTEGELDTSDEGQEIKNEDMSVQTNEETNTLSSTSTETEEEVAAAVVPVRVAIPDEQVEPAEEDIKDEDSETKQEYETYSKVIDYSENAEQQTQSSSDSEEEVSKEEETSHEERQAEFQDEVDAIGDKPETNHVDESTPQEEQNMNGMGDEIVNPPLKMPPSDIDQENEGASNTAEDEGGYLQ